MLVRDIDHYLRRTGMVPTRFGREAAGDPRLVFDLRKGRSPGPCLTARIRAYMDERP